MYYLYINIFNICINYTLLIIYNTEQDTGTLRVSQDANTLRTCPIFMAAGKTRKTLALSAYDDSGDDDDDDKDDPVVESYSSDIARSGNTSKYFSFFLHKLTSFCVPFPSSSPLSVPLFIRIHV